MILGSIYVTAGAIVVGVPIGILTAVFMAKFCPKKSTVFKAGGRASGGYSVGRLRLFGLVVIVPLIRQLFPDSKGTSMLAASLLLGIMILPTIIGVSESAIRAVPESYYEGGLALGASHERSVFLPLCQRPSPAFWPAWFWELGVP